VERYTNVSSLGKSGRREAVSLVSAKHNGQYRAENNIESEWLFPNPVNYSEQMNVATLNSWTRSFSKILNEDFYWHCLRHAHVTSLVRAGIPDDVIQELIGWSSADMCRVYTDLEAEERFGSFFKNGDIVAPAAGGFDKI